MPFANISTGARLHYTERNPQASGAPLVAIHGLLGTAETDLGPVLDWLGGEGYRVLGLTLRGYGESTPKPRDFPHDFYRRDAKDVIAFLDALGLSKAHLMGYSDGGETVMAAAGLAPERIASVVAWGAVGSFGPELRPVFQRTYPGDWITEEVKQMHGFTDARAFTGEWVKATTMMIDLGGDVSLSLAPKITAPVLLLLGEEDTLNPQSYGEKFAQAAQNGRLEMFACGHPVHDQKFDEFKAIVGPFLRESIVATDTSTDNSEETSISPLMITLVDGQLSLNGFVCTATGLVMETDAGMSGWEQVGEMLFDLEGALPWLIGDWLIYGLHSHLGDIPRIADHLGRDPKQLYDYCYVAHSIHYSRRRKTLSFKHHMLVAALNPAQQETVLRYAEDNFLSVSAFRKWLKASS